MATSQPKLTLDKHAVLSRKELEQLYAEVDRLSGEVVQLEMENVVLRGALSAAMDICESAYGCYEWLRWNKGRTAARDKAMEDIQKILAQKRA
jgi:hypothetical protein